MDRRRFMQSGLGLTISAAVLGAGQATRQPNILFLTADDLGWKDLGCYGNPDIPTPNLDRLAGQGVRFTNAFVAAPSCSASRASWMTGKAPHSVGVLSLTHRRPKYSLKPGEETVAKGLSRAGYTTGIQGKWHAAPFYPTNLYGYQHRPGGLDTRVPSSDKAIRFIKRHQKQPWFLELNFIQTHRLGDGSFKFHPDFPIDPDSIQVPEYWDLPDWPEIREELAKYYSQTADMDRIIGEILDYLDDSGQADNTLVCFASDNGPPFPGAKMSLYDRGIGTPLIMRGPGLTRGLVRDELISTVDLLPTFFETAGLKAPPDVQGSSLLSMARGEQAENPRDEIFSEVTWHVDYQPMRCIRTREWKYILNLSDDPMGLDQCAQYDWAQRLCDVPGHPSCRPRVEEELYNLQADPNEKNNLVNDPKHQGVLEDLRNRLGRYRQQTNDVLLNPGERLD